MNFVSEIFVAFFLSTLAVFVILPSRFRTAWLLLASYAFYATWSFKFIGVILLTTTIDYALSHVIERHRSSQSISKGALVTGVVANIMVLIYFKYVTFIAKEADSFFVCFLKNQQLPFYWIEKLDVILPLGISFYTFEAISYLVDVYKGQRPAKNFFKYNFYIMYFPHLISGPIVRFRELASQYETELSLPSLRRVFEGGELIALGLVFKILIANQAAGLADHVFGNTSGINSLQAWIAAFAFTVQIYFDFMGYTHIARGVSLMFNLELPLNFNHPYCAEDISDFWKRWHISLSKWIRDYLYIPLGGTSKSVFRTCLNLFLTMAIAGIWHGANWTFLVWGLYHGLLLAVYHFYKDVIHKLLPVNMVSHGFYKLLSVMTTFLAVVLGWVIFRAPTLDSAQVMFRNLINLKSFCEKLNLEVSANNFTSVVALILLILVCLGGPQAVAFKQKFCRIMPRWIKFASVATAMMFVWIMASNEYKPFIYFQF
jgi:alginate O-acetyltransferase complex protein AlgI